MLDRVVKTTSQAPLQSTETTTNEDIEVEYVAGPLLPSLLHGESVVPDAYREFENVLKRFTMTTGDADADVGVEAEPSPTDHENNKTTDEEDDEDENEDIALSNKQKRKQNRVGLAALKQFAKHPEVVEWEDVTAQDPQLLVQLKSLRHSVPVPRHWCQKRKYLSGKRGYVKPPFELPAFIRDTGITEMRDTMRNQDATKRIKVKAREKMHPKLGRLTVDYERLYDAFFKYQTKPPLSAHGDLYFEGREFAGAITGGVNERKPGILSEELRAALGMTSHVMPTPWLHAMQKYGPPPAYPHMRIPGLNAPIPDGAQWGYHPGGWGKPPVDNFMRDLPVASDDPVQLMLLNPIERNLWGELEPDEEAPEEEEQPPEGYEEGDGIVAINDEDADHFVALSRSNSTSSKRTADPESASAPDLSETLHVRMDRQRS